MIAPNDCRRSIWLQLNLLDCPDGPAKEILVALQRLEEAGFHLVVVHPIHGHTSHGRRKVRKALRMAHLHPFGVTAVWPAPRGAISVAHDEVDFLLALADNATFAATKSV